MHHMDLEPTTLPSIPLLREDKVSFELELIDLLSFMTSIVQWNLRIWKLSENVHNLRSTFPNRSKDVEQET